MNEIELKKRFDQIAPYLDEKARRLWCANEAVCIGRDGITFVALVTGISRTTLTEGVKEIKGEKTPVAGNVRRKGGGRKRSAEKDKHLKSDIAVLVESSTRGDPESPLKWTSKSTRKLAEALNLQTKRVSHTLVPRLLSETGYSLQANKKTKEGGDHPDRGEQFRFINEKTKRFQFNVQPVISVDAKKKENIGNFKNNGKEYYQSGKAPQVNVYDFLDKEKGKVTPYGVYDLSKNKGWVSVGVSADTAQFAVASIRGWWFQMGKESYSNASKLYINADGGGSNGSRTGLWKIELQKLENELQMEIHVSHFPPFPHPKTAQTPGRLVEKTTCRSDDSTQGGKSQWKMGLLLATTTKSLIEMPLTFNYTRYDAFPCERTGTFHHGECDMSGHHQN